MKLLRRIMKALRGRRKMLNAVSVTARLLDEKVPGWVDRIDLATFRMDHECHCVIGQVFPDKSFVDGLQLIGLDVSVGNYVRDYRKVAVDHGLDHLFSEDSDEASAEILALLLAHPDGDARQLAFQPLNDAWIVEIQNRRNLA